MLQTPESFFQRFHVDVRTGSEITAVDPAGKTVTVRRSDTGESYTESYDRLILSPGASPLLPPIPGVHHSRVFTLRTIPDAVKMKEFIKQENPQAP